MTHVRQKGRQGGAQQHCKLLQHQPTICSIASFIISGDIILENFVPSAAIKVHALDQRKTTKGHSLQSQERQCCCPVRADRAFDMPRIQLYNACVAPWWC